MLDDLESFLFVLLDLRGEEIGLAVNHFLTEIIKVVDFMLNLIKGKVVLILSCANNLVQISFVAVIFKPPALNLIL